MTCCSWVTPAEWGGTEGKGWMIERVGMGDMERAWLVPALASLPLLMLYGAGEEGKCLVVALKTVQAWVL